VKMKHFLLHGVT